MITDHGAVAGIQSGSTWAFLGIPFAAPPSGPLRWQPPADPGCLKTTLQASQFAPPCPQFDGDAIIGQEDCLYLNVWSPAASNGQSHLPVMAFIHGGGNVQGATGEKTKSGDLLYDGQYLAAKGDVVVVTIAYRLGVFGFLTHPLLAAESPHSSSGNYGLQDQIAALQWVQHNIAAFGGDPSRVMLFGESAGAVDTCALIASPLAKGMFSSAAMESGACIATAKAQRESEGQTVLAKAGCDIAGDKVACLRGLDAERVMRAVPATVSVASPGLNNYGPVIDGYVLTGQPYQVIASGHHNQVPLIVGSNSDETSMALPAIPTCAAYEALVRDSYPAIADKVLQEYPCSAYPTPRKAAVAVSTDARFVCTAALTARSMAQGQAAPTFRYQYSHAVGGPVVNAFGAWHGSELPAVFQHLEIAGYRPDPGDQAVADAFLKYWTNLAGKGDPNGQGTPQWDRYDPARDNYINIDTAVVAGQGLRTEQCNFWAKVTGLEGP